MITFALGLFIGIPIGILLMCILFIARDRPACVELPPETKTAIWDRMLWYLLLPQLRRFEGWADG